MDSWDIELTFIPRRVFPPRQQPGPDAFKSVPNSELIVARTAYKDNKSKYSINERTSNYTEVTTLLKDRGIDLTHKRFLILQVRTQFIQTVAILCPLLVADCRLRCHPCFSG